VRACCVKTVCLMRPRGESNNVGVASHRRVGFWGLKNSGRRRKQNTRRPREKGGGGRGAGSFCAVVVRRPHCFAAVSERGGVWSGARERGGLSVVKLPTAWPKERKRSRSWWEPEGGGHCWGGSGRCRSQMRDVGGRRDVEGRKSAVKWTDSVRAWCARRARQSRTFISRDWNARARRGGGGTAATMVSHPHYCPVLENEIPGTSWRASSESPGRPNKAGVLGMIGEAYGIVMVNHRECGAKMVGRGSLLCKI